MKNALKRFVIAFVSLTGAALTSCAFSSESLPVANIYTVTYYDDSAVPKACGYSYVREGGAANFKADTTGYGSTYDFVSKKDSDVGHYWTWDDWYLSGGTKADLSNITSDLSVYAHFKDNLYKLRLEYKDGVDFVRDSSFNTVGGTVTFGAGVTAGLSMFSFISGTFTGHPDYGYSDDFRGWSMEPDFMVDGEGNRIDSYLPAVMTAIDPAATFTGNGEGTVLNLPDAATAKIGSLYLDGHKETTDVTDSQGNVTGQVTARVNELYCYSGVKWVPVVHMDADLEPVLIFDAAYQSNRHDWSLKIYDDQAKTSPWGETFTLTNLYRNRFSIVWTESTGTTIVNFLDEAGEPIDDNLGNPKTLDFSSKITVPAGKTLSFSGVYDEGEEVLPQYSGQKIVIRRDVAFDASNEIVTMTVLSLDGNGYLYPTYIDK